MKRKSKLLLQKLFRLQPRPQSAAEAYDKWSDTYDMESGNLMIALDEIIFPELLNAVSITGKAVADIGCGTGRNWSLLLSHGPATLCGYDVSAGMLRQLKNKYAEAEVYLQKDHTLQEAGDKSIDVIVSTLALAHFTSLEQMLKEWDRVLKPGGNIIITDYHPNALINGGNITFVHNGRTLAIQHDIYTLENIRQLAGNQGWIEIAFISREIDESVKHFYEQQKAVHVYDKFKGKPIIYGIHFGKNP